MKVYVCSSDELLGTLKSAGFQITQEVSQAQLSVIEMPLYSSEIGKCNGSIVAVVNGIVDYATITGLKEKGVTVTSSNDVVKILQSLFQKTAETADNNTDFVIFGNDEGKVPSGSPLTDPFFSKGPSPAPDMTKEFNTGEQKSKISFSSPQLSVPEIPTSDPSRAIEQETLGRRSTIIASFSTKGGAGKTALATNLAAYCALNGKKSVLIDLDIGTGNTSEVLGMQEALNGPNVGNWRDYARNLQELLTCHSSGLYLLPCCEDVTIQGQDVEDLVEILCAGFDVIVMDFGTKSFFPYTKAGLEIADKVFILALQDQGMVEVLVSRFLAERKEWIENGKSVLVVNKVSPLGYYKPSQVARMAGFKTWKEIPDDPKSFEAAKKAGKTVVQLKGSEAGAAFATLSEELGILPSFHHKKEPKRGLLSRLLGR
jgi:MinD-like ATPase involved in chromosome partitioning or flagellar assembly